MHTIAGMGDGAGIQTIIYIQAYCPNVLTAVVAEGYPDGIKANIGNICPGRVRGIRLINIIILIYRRKQ